MKNFSLSRRLIAVVVGCQLLLTAGLTLIAVVYGRAALQGAFDTALTGRAASTLALVRYTEDNPPDLLFDSSMLPPASGSRAPDLFEIRKVDGRLVAQSVSPGNRGVPDGVGESFPEETVAGERVVGEPIQKQGPAYRNFRLGATPYRAVALRDVPVLDDEESVKVPARVTVVYASSVVPMNRQLTQLALSVAGATLLMLLAVSGIAVWGVHRGLAPLHDLAAEAGAISVQNWDFHRPDEMAKELEPLATAIGTVLDRLKESFRQQRDFTSDAAHELKTAVAILKSTLQSLLQRPRGEQEYRAGLDALLEDCGRLEDLLDRMLRLARIEQWAEKSKSQAVRPTELTATCEAAIVRMQGMAKARNISLELSNGHSIQLRADPGDLEVIWVNLLENAMRYGPPGSTVAMRIDRENSLASVSVEDSGPGVEPAELPYIFERFRRGDASRARSTGGFGLGLAICKALVEAYGGRIEAQNRPEGGTVVRVRFAAETN